LAIAILFYAIAIIAKPSKKNQSADGGFEKSTAVCKNFE
jgi:hypothetical protein